MPQLRSGKLRGVKPPDRMVTRPSCWGVGVGCEPGKKLAVEQNPHLAPERKSEPPSSACLQPAMHSSVSCEKSASLVPMHESSLRLPGKKTKGKQGRRAARSNKDVALQISDSAVGEHCQAGTVAAAMCWEETVRRGMGQGQQLFFSGATLQNKFSTGIERKEHSSEGLNLSGFPESSESSGRKGIYSFMEIKLKIPSSEEEIQSGERHGISDLLKPEVLQARDGTCSTEMKNTDSIMILQMQVPDLKKNLGTRESLSEPEPQGEVDMPEELDGCSFIGSGKLGTQEKGKRCLSKKDGTSLMKPELQGAKERHRSDLLELNTQRPESKKGAVNRRKRDRNALVLQCLKGLSGQEQSTTRENMNKHCMKEEQQNSNPQNAADSLGESTISSFRSRRSGASGKGGSSFSKAKIRAKEKWKAVEEDTSTPAVKKLKTNGNISEDSREKESYYSESPTVATLGGTQSKSFLGNSVTKKTGVHYKKRKPRKDQIWCLHCLSVTTAEKVRNVSEKCDAEHCRNALTHSNRLLCAAEKNPFVRLEACSYINTFVKSSANGATNSFKLSGFFHVAQDKRKHVLPDGSVEQSDMICSTSGMQNEGLPKKGDLLFNKEETQNRDGCFLRCQNENSKCLRRKKWNIGRRPGKNTKITEKSAVKNIFTDMANECSECELQTEAAVAMSSSLTVLGLNHKGTTLSDSYDHTSNLHIGKSTREAQNISVRRKSSTKLLAFENGCEKTSELSVIAKGENSNSVTHHSAASGSLRVLAPVHDVFNGHKSKTDEKLKKVNKKLRQLTCQRTVPMTGKNVWPVESCARTSAWVGKNHESISEGKKLLRADFEESFDKSSVKTVGSSAVIGNLGPLDLHMPSVEMRKESTHKIMDLNTECLTSLRTPESSSMDSYETLRVSNENAKSPVNMDRSAMAFNQDDVQEVKATLKFTTKQEGESKGAVTNLSVTAQNGTSTGNANRINFSNNASVVNETFSDLKLMKTVDAKNLTKFKIPLCRNKAESRKLESVHSFETKPCSPLELLDSTSVSRSQRTSVQKSEETFLVNSEQQPLPGMRDATSTALMEKKARAINSNQHDGSENLSKEMSALTEHSSLYPHPFLDRQLESSVPDFCGTEHVLKSNFPDNSWNAIDHPVALERNNDSKSRGNLSQHKNQKSADILKAYEEDVLIIDVIQDDPDLFGTNNEEEQVLKSEYAVMSENTDSADGNFRHVTKQESETSNDTENCCDWVQKDRLKKEDFAFEQKPITDTLEKTQSAETSFEAKDMQTHNSSRGSNPLGGVTEDFPEDVQLRELDELLSSSDMSEKFRFADGVPNDKREKKGEAGKSDCKYEDPVKCALLSGLPSRVPKVNVLNEATVMKPQKNDHIFSRKSPLLPLQNDGNFEPLKMGKNAIAYHSDQRKLEMFELPRKYCRFYFMTLHGCERAKCQFLHVPEQEDEKICMAILRTYISIKESILLKRSVQIFVKYYREVTPGVDFASQVLNDLLISLLKKNLLQEVFQILNVTVQINTLPSVDVLLQVFEHVAVFNIGDAVPTLISTFCKLIDAGMSLEFEHFDYIIKFLHKLQVSHQEINTVLNIKSRRFQERHLEEKWLFNFNLAVAEVQHCKEKSDWNKLGALYVNARTGCEHSDDLQKLSLCIAEILMKDSETDRQEVPFCDFVDAVIKKSQHNEADRIFIGRTGISVMCSYHKVLKWRKGRMVLDKLHELQINFTVLKGFTGAERLASRCQIVNKAAEIFLKTGSLDGATWVLRESEWTTNAPLWPCDEMDIINRQNLLYILGHEYLKKSLYRQAFEVLQNLPGFQNYSGTVDVSQYSCLFNKLLNACFESKNLGVSSSVVDFMLSKNIAIEFFLLRGLITALGRSCLWSKARTYYKSWVSESLGKRQGSKEGDAFQMSSHCDQLTELLSDCPKLYLPYDALGVPGLLTGALLRGCYPPMQGNLYRKLLMIPSNLSEIEMLLRMEMFLVSNACEIQSPIATLQTLQIILKRCEDQNVQNNSDYQAAVERLSLAARISDPKLILKHMTMNINMEEVYSLEHTSALKWLQENMKWAGKVWLFQ